MKNIYLLTICFIVSIIVSGCMSDKEYNLRRQQLENQASHKQTYVPFVLKGPATITLGENAVLEIRSQTQPFHATEIPSGMMFRKAVAAEAISTGSNVFGCENNDDEEEESDNEETIDY